MKKKTAHIVCMNDSTEVIVIGSILEAMVVMNKLRIEHQKKVSPCKEYNNVFFWHIHEDIPLY